MTVTYHINNDNSKVVITDTEGQTQQHLREVAIPWLRTELSRLQRQHPRAIVRVIDSRNSKLYKH